MHTLKTLLIKAAIVATFASAAIGQITNPISNGLLKTDLNAGGFQLDNVGNIGFGTTTPTSRISILPSGTPTTTADGIQLGSDVYIYRSSSGTLTLQGNVVISGTLSGAGGVVSPSGNNTWSGTNSWSGASTFNGATTIGTSGLTFSGSGAANTRTALGVAIGTNVQAYSARLAEIAAINIAPSGFLYSNGTNWVMTPASGIRTTIGLGTSDTPTFAGLTLTAPLGVTNGGTGLAAIAINKVLYSSGANTLTATDLGSFARTSILPATSASDVITALTLNSLTGALSGSILTSPTLSTNAVTTSSITALAVTTAKLADASVTTAKLASMSPALTAGTQFGSTSRIPRITVNAQGQVTVLDDVASAGILSAATITDTGSSLTGSTYGIPVIKAGAVSTSMLAVSGTTAGTFGNATNIPQIGINLQGQIISAVNVPITALVSGSAATGDLFGSTYANLTIAAGAITTTKLLDDSVSTVKLQLGAVTDAKIGTGAVTTSKILDANVTSAKIAPLAVLAGNIAVGAVGSTQIATGGVVNANLSNDAVTLGTQTTGNYVQGITSTTMTVTGSGVETAPVIIELPQALATSSAPTFAGMTTTAPITGTLSPGRVVTVSSGLTGATDTRTGLSKYDTQRPFTTIAAAMAVIADGDTLHIAAPSSSMTYSAAINWNEDIYVKLDPGVIISGVQTVSANVKFEGGKFTDSSVSVTPTFNVSSAVTVEIGSRVERTDVTAPVIKIDAVAATIVVTAPITHLGSGAGPTAAIIDTVGGAAGIIRIEGAGGIYTPNVTSPYSIVGVNIESGVTLVTSGTSPISGRLSVDSGGFVKTLSNKSSRQLLEATVPPATGIPYNESAAVIAYGSVISFDATETHYVTYNTTTGVIHPESMYVTPEGIINITASIGLTPTSLVDVIAGDNVELILQQSSDGTTWTDQQVMDTYAMPVAGGGRPFVVAGSVTVMSSSASFTSTGGFRVIVRCNTSGTAGNFVRDSASARSRMTIEFTPR